MSLNVPGGSRHADPPSRSPDGTGLVVAGAAVPAIDALNPIQLAAGNVGAGAGQLITQRLTTLATGLACFVIGFVLMWLVVW